MCPAKCAMSPSSWGRGHEARRRVRSCARPRGCSRPSRPGRSPSTPGSWPSAMTRGRATRWACCTRSPMRGPSPRSCASTGGVSSRRTVMLLGEDASTVRRALQEVNAAIRAQAGAGHSTALVVFYSGHADATALHLGGTELPLEELKTLVEGSPAGVRLLVLDACRSGAVTRVKGVSRRRELPHHPERRARLRGPRHHHLERRGRVEPGVGCAPRLVLHPPPGERAARRGRPG